MQVTVLIRETSSGKSTQLVQFLSHSGIIVKESIIYIYIYIYNQPCKIATISLADRVSEKVRGAMKIV
jgi:ATP-dependent RNA helicase DHX8/PRP22